MTPFHWLKELELVFISPDNSVTFNDQVSSVIGNWYYTREPFCNKREHWELSFIY
jgi:hypothetical protein